MSSDIKRTGLSSRPLTDLSASSHPALPPLPALPATPDTSLSAAFRHVLGAAPDSPHLPSATTKRGQDLAKRAKAEKSAGQPKGAPGKLHIGPRSGHK